jgi:heat shock protein HslJ
MSMETPTPAAAASRRAAFAAATLALLAGCTTMNETQATFDGTRWQVVSIDGQATPATESYRMQFDNGQAGARFGCNHIGGSYSVAGNVMTVVNVTQTLMGCPEPAATHESEGVAVLQQPMRIEWRSDRQVTLSNAAGNIGLRMLP